MPRKRGRPKGGRSSDENMVNTHGKIDRDLKIRVEVARVIAGRQLSDVMEQALEEWLEAGAPERVHPDQTVTCKLLGRVAAGVPIEAQEDIEDWIRLPRRIARGASFALTVAGDSMEPLMSDGDIVIVHQQEVAETGQIVVAMVEGEATVKRWYPEDHEVRLQPENPAYRPIYTDDPKLVGRVVSIIRSV